MREFFDKNYKYTVYFLVFLVIFFGFAYLSYSATSANSPIIQWQPVKVQTQVFSGGIRNIEVSFTSSKDLENIEFRIVPELEKFVTVESVNPNFVESGETQTIILNIAISSDVPSGSIAEGVIQVRAVEKSSTVENLVSKVLLKKSNKQKLFAQPLPVKLEVIDVQPALDLIEQFLLEEFGALQPPIEFEGNILGPIELPGEIFESFTQGTDGFFFLSVGSLLYNGPFLTNKPAEDSLYNLLIELESRGVIVEDLRTALNNHDIHTEETGGLLLAEGDDAVTFFPFSLDPFKSGLSFYKESGSFLYSLVVIIDKNTHALHRADHVDALINQDFFSGDILSNSSRTFVHELLHAVIFRTNCFIGTRDDEEVFVEQMLSIIDAKLSSSVLYNTFLSQTLSQFPQGEDCLDRLGLEPISQEIISQTQENVTGFISNTVRFGQTFTLDDETNFVDKIIIKIGRTSASLQGDVEVGVFETLGGLSTGPALQNISKPIADLSIDTSGIEEEFIFTPPIQLNPSTMYAFTITCKDCVDGTTLIIRVRRAGFDAYPNGTILIFAGGNWSTSNQDLYFRIFGGSN